jgi:RES domain-containing protein
MRDLTQQEKDQIEALIDCCGLSSVLMALSEICGEKAEHIAHNWQDATLAKHWATAESRIGVIVPSIVARAL